MSVPAGPAAHDPCWRTVALGGKEVVASNLGVAIVRQYKGGVVFRWGRLRPVREPEIRFMIPLVD
jgi:hypothetical protein